MAGRPLRKRRMGEQVVSFHRRSTGLPRLVCRNARPNPRMLELVLGVQISPCTGGYGNQRIAVAARLYQVLRLPDSPRPPLITNPPYQYQPIPAPTTHVHLRQARSPASTCSHPYSSSPSWQSSPLSAPSPPSLHPRAPPPARNPPSTSLRVQSTRSSSLARRQHRAASSMSF